MEPGVPFALLGTVVLLAAASWAALAGTVAVLRGSRVGAALVAAGALVLVGLEVRTALLIGQGGDDDLALARAAGLLLLAAGLYAGALTRTPRRPPTAASAAGVVVPLGAAPGVAVLGAAAGVLAAAAVLRSRRDLGAVVIASGLLAAGASIAAGAFADTGDGALLALGLRGVAALLVLGGLVVLARASLLAKVVAAILTGVLAPAVVAVGVVGTTVVRGYEREQATLVADAATGRQQLLSQALEGIRANAAVFAEACTRGPEVCATLLGQFGSAQDFALLVERGGEVRPLGGGNGLSPSESLGLAESDLVARALAGGPGAVRGAEVGGPVRLAGPEPGLALAVVQPLERAIPTDEAAAAFVYGVRVGQEVVDVDFALGGFGYSILVDGRVVATNLSDRDRAVVERAAASSGVLPSGGTTVLASGDDPTVHLRPLVGEGGPVAVLALSRGAEQALQSQRAALTTLLLASLATTAFVGALALLLGRRTVEPVRRLTVVARRVAAGDLSTATGISGRDEVGTLARAFDTMTGSLARLTGDLRASAVRLETVLASMTDGLLATDADGRITSVNRAALAMTGHATADELVGRPLDEVVDLRAVSGEAVRVSATSPLADEPAEVHAPDGTVTPVRAASAPLDDADERHGGVVLVLRDTTREREVERMKTEFLSNVSHELRTPLTPIRGYADLLSSRPGLPAEKVTAFAGTILAESLKMNRVVDLLVDVAALEAGRVEIRPRSVEVGELLDARLVDWRARAPQRAADLRRRVAAGLPPVLVDPTWLAKVLDELVDNAVKHTPAGAGITLGATTSPDGTRVRVSVRDAGPGIAASDRELLFTSFEQKDGSATRRVGGLGLGLSFVRRVAEDAGWPLTVGSGKGAEFALDVPVAEQAVVPPPRRRRAPSRR
jgi:PAS domain S-box-containing protein